MPTFLHGSSRGFWGLALAIGCVAAGVLPAAEPDAAGVEFFEKHVRPVLVQYCYECHAGEKQKGGLRLDTRGGWSTGGDSGPAIVAGKPDESLLIQAIRYTGDYEMPPRGKMPAAAIQALEKWVSLGAPDPRGDAKPLVKSTGVNLTAGREHWSYRPLSAVSPPSVKNQTWVRRPLDQWILAKLENAGLQPAAEASRETLIRRVYFDLIGLPPTPEEVDSFVADSDPEAWTRLVDRLLASPRFGERWARHWLDVARFAESITLRGFVLPEAWRYRDYVIASRNADQPFDQFVREQIAGDLMPAAAREDRVRQLIATTYLTLGNTNLEEQDKKQLELDVIDEQLDVIGKGILAQTLTCARCHDHKFDPIPQRDYYALAGIFRNTQALEHSNVSKWVEVPLPDAPEREQVYEEHTRTLAALQTRLESARKRVQKAGGSIAATNTPSAAGRKLGELPGIVVDDLQAKRVGMWKESSAVKPFLGDGYLHDLHEQPGRKTLTFVPELPRDDRYEVRLAYTPGTNRATAAKVTVFSADGERTVEVNQQEPPPLDGHFVSLGQFRFEKAGQSFVIVSNEAAGGHVVADAVQFLAVSTSNVAERPASAAAEAPTAKKSPQLAAAEAGVKELESQLKKLQNSAPPRPMAMSLREKAEIQDSPILIRGIVHHPGEIVPRGFLQVCSVPAPERLSATQSGRLELAQWLTDPRHPLTTRVQVNRVWHSLFGTGIVRSVDNFGLTGELPSHPELLDYLASRFVQQGWSLKQLIREIVLSATYRQAARRSGADHPAANLDPENRWLAGVNRRRLDAEVLRDSMLQISGELRGEMGGPAFAKDLSTDYGYEHAGRRRSVYEPAFRNSLVEFLEVFDLADSSLATGRRATSTVAPQALFLMNHPFVLEQSKSASQRILAETADGDRRLLQLFRMTLGRPPLPGEQSVANQFLSRDGADLGRNDEQRWVQLCHSLFSSIDFRYVE